MSELVKIWLCDLYDDVIKDAKASIRNSELWLLGATDEGLRDSIKEHISALNEYIEVVGELRAQVRDEEK